MSRPTIYDIAQQAQVSIATVSRVFNGSPRVSAATRERVEHVAEQLNYRPNVSARNLASQRSNLVMAVVPMLTNYFYMEVVRGVQDRLADTDLDLLVYTAQAPEYVDGQLERALQRGRTEGVLLFSTPLTDARAELVRQADQPVVLVDSSHSELDSVFVDNERGGYEATRHLIEMGYRRIGYLSGHPMSVPAVDRQAGYGRALREAGLPFDPDRIYTPQQSRDHGYTECIGYEGMQALLKQDLDAVFVASDIQALGALRAIHEAGLRVPEDLGVVGFDDIAVSAYVGLTTMRQPMYDMGRQAVDALLSRLNAPVSASAHSVHYAELVRRNSTEWVG